MNWFDGYIFYDNFILLFTKTEGNYPESYTIPYFHINIEYNFDKKQTELSIVSTQDCSDFSIRLSITNTNINNTLITISEDNNYYLNYNENEHGIFTSTHIITLDVYNKDNLNVILTRYSTPEFSQIHAISDQLKLINYISEYDIIFTLTIPLIEKSVYDSDKELYNIKLLQNLNQANLSENRFPTDEVQYRFLNTYYINNLYLRNITVQKYDFDLYLPLLLTVNIIYNEQYINSNNLDLNQEKYNLYLEIANILQTKYTGNVITYYDTHLIDLIQSKPYIKTLSVLVKDSNNTTIPSGLEIYENDIIMQNLQNDSIETDELSNKLNIANYNPYYFWWDVNNITVNYSF